LKNGEVNFNQIVGTNQILVKFDINNVTPVATANLDLSFTLNTWKELTEEGYFGQVTKVQNDNDFKFSIFEDLQILIDNDFVFGEILFDGETFNKSRVPFYVTASNLRMYKNDEHLSEILYTDVTNANVKAADLNDDYSIKKLGEGKFDELSLKNANIGQKGKELPNKIKFDLTGVSNPDGRMPDNYIDTEHDMDVNVAITFPTIFRAEFYQRTDTVDFNINSLLSEITDDSTQVKNLEFFDLYLKIRNRMPFDVKVDVYAIDDKEAVVDHIKTFIQTDTEKESDVLMVTQSQKKEPNGYISDADFRKFIVRITGEQALDFCEKSVKKLIFHTSSVTDGDGKELVKVFSNSGMNIIVSFDTKIKAPTNINK
jgi:hypothetical protein